jgi:hypothetical protein
MKKDIIENKKKKNKFWSIFNIVIWSINFILLTLGYLNTSKQTYAFISALTVIYWIIISIASLLE